MYPYVTALFTLKLKGTKAEVELANELPLQSDNIPWQHRDVVVLCVCVSVCLLCLFACLCVYVCVYLFQFGFICLYSCFDWQLRRVLVCWRLGEHRAALVSAVVSVCLFGGDFDWETTPAALWCSKMSITDTHSHLKPVITLGPRMVLGWLGGRNQDKQAHTHRHIMKPPVHGCCGFVINESKSLEKCARITCGKLWDFKFNFTSEIKWK